MDTVVLLLFARCLNAPPSSSPPGPQCRRKRDKGDQSGRPSPPGRAPAQPSAAGDPGGAGGGVGVGRNTTTPAARPPARPVIGLGGASARPGEREGPCGRPAAQAGWGERAGRSTRGAGARVPGIAERALGGRENHRRGREPGELSAEPGELRASRRSARSRSRRSARPRSLPGGSGAAAGCSLTCRSFPAGRRRRTEGRGTATHLSGSQRLGPRAGRRLHGDRDRGAGLRTFGRGGEFLPRVLWEGDGATPL